jgi:hypothetical protein
MGKGPAEEIGAPNSEELKKYLENLDEEMDTFKDEKISKGWDKIPGFYSGKNHWSDYRPRHKVSPVLNFLKRAIERKTSLMTDARPYIDVLPFYDSLWPVANALQDIIASKWFEQSLDMVITDIVFYAELFGSGGTNTLFDQTLRNGLGDITLQFIDPRNLNFDPMITQSQYLDRAEYVRIEQVRATSLLKHEYNNDKIQADAVMAAIQPRRTRGLVGRTTRKLSDILSKSPALNRTLEKEYWIQDRTMKSAKELKYPGGRHVIIAGGELVVDQSNPYWDLKFPTDMLDWHTNPDSAWGDGDILDLTELQLLLNKLVAIIVENGLLTANAIWIGDANALEPDEWDSLDNVPGLKVKKKPGSELRREPGADLPGSIFNLIAYLEGAIEKLLGNTEVVQGSTPGEVKSGVAIEALQTAALAIIRLKSRSVESLLNRVGQKMVSRIFQFETQDRSMFSYGSNEEYKKFEFMKSLIRGNKETRKYFKNKQDVWKNFLFKIRPGSSLQLNNWQKSMIAMQMYQMPRPLLDRKAVLETMDWPNREAIMARLKIEEQEQLEQALALQGASGGPGSSGGSPARLSNPTGPGANQAVTKGMI